MLRKQRIVVLAAVLVAAVVCLMVAYLSRPAPRGGQDEVRLADKSQPSAIASQLPHGGTVAESRGAADVDPFIAELSRSTRDDMRVVGYQLLLDGMVPADQPDGYTNSRVWEARGGRRAAFLSRDKDGIAHVIVIDRQTKDESRLPAPEAYVYERRHISDVQWDDKGEILYVVELATDAIRSQAALDALTSDERHAQMANGYYLLYSCKLGGGEPQILDRMKGRALALRAGAGRVRLLSQSSEKGAGFVDLREYRDGERVSLKTLPVVISGKAIDHDWPQILCKRNELWFITNEMRDDRVLRTWLAMVNLDKPDSEARLIAPDVKAFIWSPDEERIFVQKLEVDRGPKREERTARMSWLLLRRDALDHPSLLALKDDVQGDQFGTTLAGIGHDGRMLYFQSLAKAVATYGDLGRVGATRIYQWKLPE